MLSEDPQILNIKFLNESAIKKEIESSVKLLKTVINYMEITKLIQFNIESRETLRLSLLNKKDYLKRQLDKFSNVSEKILRYLYDKSTQKKSNQELITISFSVLELKNQYEKTKSLIDEETSLDEIESCIYMLQRFGIIHVEGGFLVTYSPMSIKRIIKDNYKKYTKADYSKLETFYKSKMQQIHIVGEYAAKMVKDYQSALQFVQDYFTFDYQDFLNKYFTGQRKRDINHNLSPKRFKQLFGSLTTEQLNVILDKDHKRIAVAAGPGSGKTKLLVHKLASIIYTEDIRQEQLLMLTFSRAAVIEFKNRLFDLIGPSAKYIDITTFHSFCFDILGQVGDLEKTKFIIKEAAELIEKYEADPMKITRSVLVIDEAQDINEDEYNLIQKLIQYNEGLRVIAVGDDDQNIFEFRGSSSKYFRQIASEEGAFYELPINFRSKKNIVDFANVFTKHMKERLKRQPIRSYTNDMGKIKIHYYKDTNLIVPLVNDVINTTLEGTKCIITPTNEQAYHITGLLNKHGFPAQLIQDFSYLKLFNILEMRYFYNLLTELQSPIISDEQLNSALDIFRNKFSLSTNYQVCLQALDVFKNTVNIQIYLTDFLQFLYESNLSDFNHDSNILVSTFHKAKGKEFDQVFILLDSISSIDEKELRKIYVGLTRAKTYLNIHTTSKIFNKVNTDQTENYTHEEIYDQPDRLVFFLAHDDVNLGYFKFVQKNLKNLLPGAKLDIVEDKLIFHEKKIIRLSKKGFKYLNDTIESGYELTAVFLEHVLYWKDKLEEQEYLIALPKLIFDKKKEIED
jgi:ATP-dependent DNA helicase RecQ